MMRARSRTFRKRRESALAAILPRWRIALSRTILLWERLWPALWPGLAFAGLFLVLALIGVPQALPGWLHSLLLVGFGVAIIGCLWRGARALRVPDREESLRHIEQINELDHRPLETLEDNLATGLADSASRDLWRLHQERMKAAVARLRIGWPQPQLIRRDPFAFRIGLGVALIAGFLAVGNQAGDRILQALTPDLLAGEGKVAVKLDAWITPPDYTRKPPVFLASGELAGAATTEKTEEPGVTKSVAPGTVITVPKGSKLVIRLTGGRTTPELAKGEAAKPFEGDDKAGYHIEEDLAEPGRILVRQDGAELVEWDVAITDDTVPTVAFSGKPSESQRKALRLDFEATDDYGVEQVTASITRSGGDGEQSALANLPPIELELPLPGVMAREIKSTSYHDLTPHPWAGLPVNIQLMARDAADQIGKSTVVQAVLPERVFTHPVARAIIKQRRQLAVYPNKNRNRVAANLEILAWEHEEYSGDVVVFMALTSASRRLERGYRDTPEHVAGVMKLLWDTALRLEDGTLSLSEQALREAQQALQDALRDGAEDKELEKLLRELERAMDEYLNSLAESMKDAPRQPNELNQQNDQNVTLNRNDLKKMLDRIRELMKSGQRDAAKQMLSQLQNMLENLRTRRLARPGQQQQRAMQMLNDLQNIIRDQQKLLDKTFREAQRRGQMRKQDNRRFRMPPNTLPPGMRRPDGQPNQSQPPLSQESQSQEALRKRLGELMRELGEMSDSVPRPLGRAERSMRGSTDKLGKGQAGQAVPPQTDAIDQLQQGARAATEALMRQFGQRGQRGEGNPNSEARDRQRDPFGRTQDNDGRGMNTEQVEIPDQDRLRDARRIRDELRRRAGQRTRPQPELDYIDRLLKQF